MIVVHHLNESRSQRILWLLEELKLPYEIRWYYREEHTNMAPPELPVSPDWSPVKEYGGYARSQEELPVGATASYTMSLREGKHSAAHKTHRWILGDKGLWSLGCDCFAF